ncbi:MAG: hypothetical protein AB7K24_29425 [Gemmataceae bacterium]
MTPRQRARRQDGRRARHALCWGVAALVACLLGLNALMERWHPDEFDLVYARRSEALKQRRHEHPGSPVVLVMGSSRVAMGFAPEWLEEADGSGQRPLIFNFSRFGQGPKLHRITMQRLARDGLLPDAFVLELIPSHLYKEGDPFIIGSLGTFDLETAHRYMPLHRLLRYHCERRLELVTRYPQRLLGLRDSPVDGEGHFNRLGGYADLEESISAEERRTRMAQTYRYYYKPMTEFRIAPASDRALRDCLAFCQSRGIKVVLLLTPEGTTLRSWYAPGADQMMADYFAALQRDYQFQLVDGRNWLADHEFYDDHHMLRGGAETFTHRLDREVLANLFGVPDDQRLVNK